MPPSRPAAEWVRTVPLDCPHVETFELHVCYACMAANLDAYARQRVEVARFSSQVPAWVEEAIKRRVEAFRERVANLIENLPIDIVHKPEPGRVFVSFSQVAAAIRAMEA